jgi:hypothetical protein
MSEKAKSKALDAFAAGAQKHWFLGPQFRRWWGLVKAPRTGLSLGEMFFTLGIMEQAADRIHSINQKQPVTVYYGVCPGTIDDLQYRLVEESRKVLSDIIGGEADVRRLSNEIADKFLESLATV